MQVCDQLFNLLFPGPGRTRLTDEGIKTKGAPNKNIRAKHEKVPLSGHWHLLHVSAFWRAGMVFTRSLVRKVSFGQPLVDIEVLC